MSRSFLLRNERYFRQSFRGNQNTHFLLNNFFFPENSVVYEIMWKNILEPDRPQMATWHMFFACWILEATNTG